MVLINEISQSSRNIANKHSLKFGIETLFGEPCENEATVKELTGFLP